MNDEEPMTHDAGALSSQGRFQRMEDALNRIETKLDAKADSARVERVAADVEEIRLNGSPQVIKLEATVTLMDARLKLLESARTKEEAENTRRVNILDSRTKIAIIVASFFDIATAMLVLWNFFHH